MTRQKSFRSHFVEIATRAAIWLADGARRAAPVLLIMGSLLSGAAVWLTTSASAGRWIWKGWERMFGPPSLTNVVPHIFAQMGGSGNYTITTIDEPSAGTSAMEGTIVFAVNASGAMTGTYSDQVGVAHGFIYASGKFTSFDALNESGLSPQSGWFQGTTGISIDTAGDVVGTYADSNNAYHGFLLPAGSTTPIDFDDPNAPTATSSRGTFPMAINDSGQITGFYTTGTYDTASQYHGFLYSVASEKFMEIDDPSAGTGEFGNNSKEGTVPIAINTSGVVTGYYVDTAGTNHGFIFSSGNYTSFDAPGAFATGHSGLSSGTVPLSIDAAGDVIGTYIDSNLVRHGFILPAGSTTATSFDAPGANTTSLKTGIGYGGTYPIHIDPTGSYVTGIYTDASGLGHGFVYYLPLTGSGSFTTFTPPNMTTSTTVPIQGGVFGVNASGTVVGFYLDTNEISHGFEYMPTATPAPTFSPAQGTYSSAQSVTIVDTDSAAAIYYTTDGSTPTVKSTKYSEPISVSSTETINAIALDTTSGGYIESADASAVYTINNALLQAATPTFSPAAGSYSSAQSVAISDTTSGATIYYTVNGTTPTTSSTVYSSPITVSSSETIEAIAMASGYSLSSVASAAYTITTASQGTLTTVANFNGANGKLPFAGSMVQGPDGNLYGTTEDGGAEGSGAVFQVTPAGNLTAVYSFCSQSNCDDGGDPVSGLTLAANGLFYGTALMGGPNQCTINNNQKVGCGTVFAVSTGGQFTQVHAFSGGDGASPFGSLVQSSNGSTYGITTFGGANNDGTVFQITSNNTFSTLYTFCSSTNCSDGSYPESITQGADGNLYGTTIAGGNGYGSIFKITPQGTLTTLYSFCSLAGCSDGYGPYGGIVQATDGNFYGAAALGGANISSPPCDNGGGAGNGTLFRITPSGVLTTLYDFQDGSDGAVPDGTLIQATDGNLYGTTACGGNSGAGTVFRLTTAGTFTALASFTGPNGTGAGVEGGLFQATNGVLYGTTPTGGANGDGIVFSLPTSLAPFVRVVPSSGSAGEVVSILGNSLTGATTVSFNGTPATFNVVSASEIQATVPTGAVTGIVQVTTAGGTLNSNSTFQVTTQAVTQAATPTFAPPAGTYTSAQSVTISDATLGAAIYYTTNGTTPTTSSTAYTNPVTVSSSETLEAIAVAGGDSNSVVGSAAYTINVPNNPVPVLSSLTPAFISAGNGTINLTVSGTGFVSGSTVYWNSSALATTSEGANYLEAAVPTSDLASPGTAAITVQSPAPGGGTSNTLDFEIQSGSLVDDPTFSTTTATVTPGGTATYPVTLPSGATDGTVICLNLPAGAGCTYTATSGQVTILTLPSTPAGTYQITVVFTETLPGAASGMIIVPILLLPLAWARRQRMRQHIWIIACLGLVVLVSAMGMGCGGGSSGGGGGGGGGGGSQTHTVTASGEVTLTVQ